MTYLHSGVSDAFFRIFVAGGDIGDFDSLFFPDEVFNGVCFGLPFCGVKMTSGSMYSSETRKAASFS